MRPSIYNIYKETDKDMIIYNVNSGGVLKLNEFYRNEYHGLFKKNETSNKELISALKMGNMIIDDETDEIKNLQIKSMINRLSDDHLLLTIAPSMKCNFKCTYCYEEGYRNNVMNNDIQSKVIDFVKTKINDIKGLGISWYGGEPLLALDIIEKLTKSFLGLIDDDKMYYASIVTNGYFLSKEVANKLKDLKIGRVQVTLDGPQQIHDKRRFLYNGEGTFQRIIDNIRETCELIPITIRINIDKTNTEYARELLNCFEQYGLKGKVEFYLAPVDNINNTCINSECMTTSDFSIEEINFQSEAIERGFKISYIPSCNSSICGAVSINAFVIDPLGDLYKCWNHIGHQDECVGSIISNTFTHNIYKWMLYNPFSEEKCLNCKMLPACILHSRNSKRGDLVSEF